jgi:subtilisin family serine protease
LVAADTDALRYFSNREDQIPQPTVDQAKYDGTFYAHTKNDLQEPGTFETLRKTWKQRLEYMKDDKVMKIAILDTGIDMQGTEVTANMHQDFRSARAVRFDKGHPCPDPNDIPQFQRIKGTRNFCAGGEAEVQDLDGHGTAVAGIILRLAPGAELYIARICDGDINNGVAEENWRPVGEDRIIKPRPSIIKKARTHQPL